MKTMKRFSMVIGMLCGVCSFGFATESIPKTFQHGIAVNFEQTAYLWKGEEADRQRTGLSSTLIGYVGTLGRLGGEFGLIVPLDRERELATIEIRENDLSLSQQDNVHVAQDPGFYNKLFFWNPLRYQLRFSAGMMLESRSFQQRSYQIDTQLNLKRDGDVDVQLIGLRGFVKLSRQFAVNWIASLSFNNALIGKATFREDDNPQSLRNKKTVAYQTVQIAPSLNGLASIEYWF